MLKKAIRKLFVQENVGNPTTTELAFADTNFYNSKDFPKYDPDMLKVNKGFGIYKKMMTDYQVKAVTEFKRHAIVSRSWYFDQDSDNEQHEEIAKYFEYVIKRIQGSFTDKLIGILSALYNGFSISEKVYMPVEYENTTKWGVRDIKLKPANTFNGGILVDPYGNINGIEQRSSGKAILIPLSKIIHFVHQPDMDEHYGESDLRACYRDWWSKDIAIKMLNIHLERHASGFVWAHVKGTLSVGNKSVLQDFLNNISARTSAMIPENVDLKNMNPMRTDAYDRAVVMYNKAIAKSILVPNLLGVSEQGPHGSLAQSSTQERAFFWVLDAIAKRLEDTLNEQVFRQLSVWNYGTEDFPLFKFEPISEEQKKEIVTTWNELVKGRSVTPTDADESHTRRLMGYPEKEEVEDEDIIPDSDNEIDELEEIDIPDTPEDPDEEKVKVIEDTEKQLRTSLTNKAYGKKGYTFFEKEHRKLIDYINNNDAFEKEVLPLQEPFLNTLGGAKKNHYYKQAENNSWVKRVDFAAIDQSFKNQSERFSGDMADTLAPVVSAYRRQISKLFGPRSGSNINPAELVQIKFPKVAETKLRKVIRLNLQRSMDIGEVQARKELPKKNNALPDPTAGLNQTQAEKFLSSRAIRGAMGLSQDTQNAVLDVLQNSIKYDFTLKQTMDALANNTDLVSMLPKVDSGGAAVNVPARLETIARTNITEATNLAREALFGGPEFQGFVEAYEYSATLDDRTCFPKDTKVKTGDGEKNIQDVVKGDTVITHKGEYQTVNGIFNRDYKGSFVKIKTDAGELICSADHPIYCKIGDEYKFIHALSLKEGMEVVCLK
jgi:hypothetical protein